MWYKCYDTLINLDYMVEMQMVESRTPGADKLFYNIIGTDKLGNEHEIIINESVKTIDKVFKRLVARVGAIEHEDLMPVD